jgi:hypothetical protein
MSVKKFSNFFGENEDNVKIDETLFSSNYLSFDENKNTEGQESKSKIEDFPIFYEID